MPSPDRYDKMIYNRSGRSGLKLPAIALGLWHNFAGVDPFETARAMVNRAFDLGITHFDLANNYGPPPGSAEEVMGRILAGDLAAYRDELIISTKAGYGMWPGPYGDFGSRKYLIASLDQSLKRMGVDYVDIFYHHRPDEETPLEETMAALDYAVRSGRALYVGISSYSPERTRDAAKILRELGTPCIIHQPSYSMFNRRIEENGLLDTLGEEGIGCIAFCPLAQGLLTSKYLEGVPDGSRATKSHGFLKRDNITDEKLATVRALNEVAAARGQSLAQMALRWVLRHETMTTALIGASRPEQIEENVASLQAPAFSADELSRIESILAT
jgi:L-glyceraldehyde 3-phosphate reductase